MTITRYSWLRSLGQRMMQRACHELATLRAYVGIGLDAWWRDGDWFSRCKTRPAHAAARQEHS